MAGSRPRPPAALEPAGPGGYHARRRATFKGRSREAGKGASFDAVLCCASMSDGLEAFLMSGPVTVLDEADVTRALVRIAHEVVERNKGTDGLLVVGIHTRGVPLARRLAAKLGEIEGRQVPAGALDVAMYRDDIGMRPPQATHDTELPFDLAGKVVVLVDDVLYTGRTVRAALDALTDFGRPRAIQLAVLVDRGHRELPLRADYVGKNLPTSPGQAVRVLLAETDGSDGVVIEDTDRKAVAS